MEIDLAPPAASATAGSAGMLAQGKVGSLVRGGPGTMVKPKNGHGVGGGSL